MRRIDLGTRPTKALKAAPMSFLKSLFGLGGSGAKEGSAPAATKELEHKGFLIRAEPYLADGQYQVAGTVEKRIADETKQHRFVRADRFASADEAADFALRKGCQIIDEQGDGIFR
jgi:hypothetical protein